MRIAYLTHPYAPMISGSAIVTQQLAEAMAKRGHQVLVIAASDREHPYYTYTDNMTVMRLGSFNNPMRVGQRIISHPRRTTLDALRQFQPDIIHTSEPMQMGVLALEHARRTHIPVMFTLHQLPWLVTSYVPTTLRPLAEKILWIHTRWFLNKYSAIITPTETIATVVKQMTGLKPKAISNGIDLQTFHPPLASDDGTATRNRWNLPLCIPILLHVGRLDAEKHVDYILKACRQALQNTPAHLFIVGDGNKKKRLIRLSRDLGIEECVHFAGFVSPQNGLPDIYRMANAFVTASEIETQGIVLLEAAASGLPIVAVNATCIPEIVHDQVNGFLIKSGDTSGFGNAIVTLIDNSNMAKAMGQEGRILAEEHANHHTWQLHEQLYFETIKQTRG